MEALTLTLLERISEAQRQRSRSARDLLESAKSFRTLQTGVLSFLSSSGLLSQQFLQLSGFAIHTSLSITCREPWLVGLADHILHVADLFFQVPADTRASELLNPGTPLSVTDEIVTDKSTHSSN